MSDRPPPSPSTGPPGFAFGWSQPDDAAPDSTEADFDPTERDQAAARRLWQEAQAVNTRILWDAEEGRQIVEEARILRQRADALHQKAEVSVADAERLLTDAQAAHAGLVADAQARAAAMVEEAQAAQQAAWDIRRQAEADALAMRAAAEAGAGHLRSEAEATRAALVGEAEALRGSASTRLVEAERRLTEAETEVARIVADAEARARAIVAEADARRQQVEAEASATLAAAGEEAERVRIQVAEAKAEILGQARDLHRRAEAWFAEADRQRSEAEAAEKLEAVGQEIHGLPQGEEPGDPQAAGTTPAEVAHDYETQIPTDRSGQLQTVETATAPGARRAMPTLPSASPAGGPATGGGHSSPSQHRHLEVLFVCTANICRSPTAEALFRHRVSTLGIEATVRSAGVNVQGKRTDRRAIGVLRRRGITVQRRRSVPVTAELLSDADLVLAVSADQAQSLVGILPSAWPRIFTIKELIRRSEEVGQREPDEPLEQWLGRAHAGRPDYDLLQFPLPDEIADPTGGPEVGYEHMVDEIDALTDRLIGLLWPRAVDREETRTAPR